MFEAVGNMHMHTYYSDGEKWHAGIAADAITAGLDFIIVTDHNVWVDGIEGYVETDQGRVLVLVGEEVHDVRRDPQCNHMLIYGGEQELSPFNRDPQQLIDAATQQPGALCFLAHPHELDLPLFGGKPDLGWKDWDIQGYAGLEIWNYMSSFANELARQLPPNAQDNLWNKLRALRVALNPARYVTAPEAETLAKWDELLARGQRVAAVGNSDAHATPMRLGPLQRAIFPYTFLFRAVNTHILTREALNGEVAHDKALILQALAQGNAWVGYDMAHPTKGFRFTGQGTNKGIMGDEVRLDVGATLQAWAPRPCHMRLINHGQVVAQAANATNLTHIPVEGGAYRVECHLLYQGQARGWIYSNPIYLR